MAHWFSRLSPTPTFPSTTGPYSVGTVDVEIAASELQDSSASTFAPSATIAFRAYYPCETPETSTKPVYWVQAPQKSTISAYARFLGAGSRLSNLLSWVPVGTGLYHAQISANRDARLHDSPAASGRWPVVVFSHGLGGSRNAYSQLCASIASEGQIVLAPEHRDGSCPISYVRATDNTAATTVDYKRFSHKVSPEVYEGRDEQLKIRLWELNLLHRALQKMESGEGLKNLDQKPSKKDSHSSTTSLAQFQGRLAINKPGSITWAGHSFGATTTVQFIKSIFYHPANPHYHNSSLQGASSTPSPLVLFEPSAALLSQITPNTPTILLDIWALPLNSPSTAALKSQCMPAFTVVTDGADGLKDRSFKSSPVLAVLSSAFVNWTSNFNDVKELLSHPSAAGRREPMTPLAQSRPAAHIFYPIDSAHLGQSDFGVLFPLVTKYLSKAQEPERTLQLNVRAIIQVLRECGNTVVGKHDNEILSREAGRVRGWIAVDADERGEQVLRREGKKSANAKTEALRQA